MQREIKYNTRYRRWEVYGPRSVVRAGQRQPDFVAAQEEPCRAYVARVTEREVRG